MTQGLGILDFALEILDFALEILEFALGILNFSLEILEFPVIPQPLWGIFIWNFRISSL